MSNYDGSINIDTKIDTKNVNNAMDSTSSKVKKLGLAIVSAFAIKNIGVFVKDSVKATTELSNAFIGLESVLQGQGKNFSAAKKYIQEYTEDGLVAAKEATNAYKNLSLRGYSHDQTKQVMDALKDSATFGRQSSYELGAAVETATEGLKNENSILVDNAGVTKNVAKMWDDYARSIGTTSNKLSQQQKIQAEVNGILTETQFQTGDAAIYLNTYSGQVSRLTASFTTFKQAVGNAIIPVLQAIIPYIVSAIEGLTYLAKIFQGVVQLIFGKTVNTNEKLAKSTNKAAKGMGKLGKSTKEAGKQASKALAPFDEITSIVEEIATSGAGAGGVGDIGSGDVDLGNFETPDIDTSILEGKINRIAKIIKGFLESGMNLINKYSPILKGIAAGFLVAFGFKWIAGVLTKFSKLKVIAPIILAIKSALLGALLVFKLTGNPLKAIAAGFQVFGKSITTTLKNLTSMQKFTLAIAGFVAVFTTSSAAIKKFKLGTSDLGTTLLNILPITVVVGTALTLMLGPIGLIVTGVALLTGAIAGAHSAQVELNRQMADSIMFNDKGVTIDTLTTKLIDNNKEVFNSIQRVGNWNQTIEDNNKKIDDNISTIDYFTDKLIYSGSITQEETTTMKQSFADIRTSVKENFELATKGILETFKVTLSGVAKDVGIDLDSMSKDIFNFQDLFGKKTGELETQIYKLEQQMSKTGPTNEQLSEWSDLKNKYVELNKEIPIATTRFNEQIDAFNSGKINFKDTETAKEKIVALGDTFNELTTGVGDSKEKTLNEFDNLMRQVPLLVSDPAQQQQLVSAFQGYKDKAREGFEMEEELIKLEFNTQMQRIHESFESNIDEAAKGSSASFWEDFYAGITTWSPGEWEEKKNKILRERTADSYKPIAEEIDKVTEKTKLKSREIGEAIPVGLGDGVQKNAKIPKNEIENIINELDTTSKNKELINAYFATGKNIDEGLADGLNRYIGLPKDEAKKLGNSIINETKMALDSHSPSRKFVEIGKDTNQGFANGIRDSRYLIFNEVNYLINEMSKMFDNARFNLNMPDISNSANSVIYKFQTMLNRMGGGLNNWLSKITSSMNNVRVNSNGNLGYSGVGNIGIPMFAKGAVIPPNNPFIGIMGDQKHGTNLETPEALLRKIYREENSNNASNSEETTINLTSELKINGKTMARETIEDFNDEAVRRGYKPILNR